MAEIPVVLTDATDHEQSTARPLLAFFVLTFIVTWTCFIGAVAWSRSLPAGAGLGPGISALILLGTFAPGMVALALTARAEGEAGVRALLARLFRWQVKARWYAFALGYIVAIKLTAAVVYRFVAGEWPRFGHDAWYLMVAAALLSTMIGGQTGEEIGWRGYALPRLWARLGLARASIVLGVIWALWHLPLFYLRGAEPSGQSFPVYLLQVTAISVAIAWLYWRTNGSLLLTMLMHAAINNIKDIVPMVPRPAANPLLPDASLMAWLTMGVMWMVAAYCLVRMRKAMR